VPVTNPREQLKGRKVYFGSYFRGFVDNRLVHCCGLMVRQNIMEARDCVGASLLISGQKQRE
jgi:hypothetical protein